MYRSYSYIFLCLFFYSSTLNSQSIKPNIVIINIDDLGWKDLGFMGAKFYQSHNIDNLSKQGMVFTNAYASASNCAPSRASLMTGKWATRHKIYTVGTSKRGESKHRKLIPIKNKTTLSKKFRIIPQVLRSNDYITCHAGKWHLSQNPLEYGFDINIGGGSNGHPSSYYPPYRNVNLKEGKNKHLTDLIMQKTIDFIDTVSHPFFLNYSPYAVHTPIQPIDSLIAKYQSKKTGEDWNYNIKYATMIENLDRNIGLLISKLKEKKLFDKTLLIFTSDNGGLYRITNQYPLRAGKGSYYEGGIRVPLFFVWKGKIKPNSKNSIPITHLDIFPTILSILDIGIEDYEFDGDDIKLVLDSKSNRLDTLDRALFWHFPVYLEAYKTNHKQNRDKLFRTRPGSVLRMGNWKIHYYFEDQGIELYDLSNDVGERKNLANINKEKTKKMMSLLKSIWKKTNSPIPKQINPKYQN